MNILIYYEHKQRELTMCYYLKNALEMQGNIVAIYNINFETLRAKQYCKKNPIDVIVVPWCYQKTDFYPVTSVLKMYPQVKILNLHCEQICAPLWECTLFNTDEAAQKYVYHIAWGTKIKEKMIASGIPGDQIFVTGNIRMKAYKSLTREQLAKRYNLDPKKKWILFAETRDTLSTITEKSLRFYEQTQGLNYDMAIEEIEIGKKSLLLFWNQLKNLTEEFFEKYEFIYRPHPGGVAPCSTKNIKIISDLAIQVWFEHLWLDISYSSTSTFEADAAGVPCLIHEPIDPFLPAKTSGLEEYPIIRNINEINDSLVEEIRLEEKEKRIFEEYIGDDSHALEKTIDVIYKLKDLKMKYPKSLFRANRKRAKIQETFEIITFFVTKLNLLSILKFPRAAYNLRLDIPYYKGK